MKRKFFSDGGLSEKKLKYLPEELKHSPEELKHSPEDGGSESEITLSESEPEESYYHFGCGQMRARLLDVQSYWLLDCLKEGELFLPDIGRLIFSYCNAEEDILNSIDTEPFIVVRSSRDGAIVKDKLNVVAVLKWCEEFEKRLADEAAENSEEKEDSDLAELVRSDCLDCRKLLSQYCARMITLTHDRKDNLAAVIHGALF